MNQISQFRFPVDIRFGVRARNMLAEFAKKFKVSKPLLITDSKLAETEVFRIISGEMARTWPGGYECFTGVSPNPTDRDVDHAFKSYQKSSCDGVVGVGGGSAIDAARAMRLKVTFPSLAILDIPFDHLPDKLTPFCAVPTTAGTGSEVGQSNVITIRSLERKVVIGTAQLMAGMAILDPELTIGLPADN